MSDNKTSTKLDPRVFDGRLLAVLYEWIDRVQEADREHLEAELDRGSFESFPASDPVASAVATQRRTTVRIECEIDDDRLTFSRGLRTEDPGGPDVHGALSAMLEGETPSGVRVRIAIHSRDGDQTATTPENLAIPPEHASIAPQQDRDRGGNG